MRERLLKAAIGTGLGVALVVGVLPVRSELELWLQHRFLELTIDRALVVVAVVGLGTAALAFIRRAGVAETPRRALARGASSFRAVSAPAEIVLPLTVGAAAAFRIVVNAGASLPRVFGDELIYSNLAKSFAATGSLVVRGVEDNGHSILYPILISPLYAAAGDGVAAFDAVQVFNAVVISLTAVPAYFLARRLLSTNWALAVAALSVFVPATGYSALVMSESLFYPGFVTFALALVTMLERPTVARQLLTVATLVALVGVRTQALALLPAVATAVALEGWRSGRLRRRLTGLWPLWGILALVAVGFLAASRVGAEAPTGAYGDLVRFYDPADVVRWALWSLAQYELSLGVVALAASAVAMARLLRRDASPAELSFGSTAASLALWTLVSVAILAASPYGLGILHERSLFYVTPLVLVCFAHWLSTGMPRPGFFAPAVAATMIALAVLLPERLALHGSVIDNPTNVFWLGLHDRVSGVPFRWLVMMIAVLGVATFLYARSAVLPLFSFGLMVVFITANLGLHTSPERPETDRLAWVDRALPDGERAALVHVAIDTDRCPAGSNTYQGEAVVWTEFFNKSVDRVYHVLGPVVDDGLASPTLQIAADGTLLLDGALLRPRYAVVDSRIRIRGTELAGLDLTTFPGFATDVPGRLSLWRPDGALRLVFPGPLLNGRPEQIACPGKAGAQ